MKKKIQIYSSTLGYGGIEREVVTLANSLVSLYNIELVFLNSIENVELNIDKKIKVTVLDISSLNMLSGIKLKKYIEENSADVIIATDSIYNKYLTKVSSVKIFWEHNHHDNNKIIIDELRKNISSFDKVVVPNKLLFDIYKNIKDDVHLISNVIELDSDSISQNESDNIIFVGKLEYDKRVDLLIDVFSLVSNNNDKAKLFIVGDGSLKAKLHMRVRELNLKDKVVFLGLLNKDEVKRYLRESSVFVTCSQSESFGISLVEAMNSALPSVVFDDVYAFKEIIDDEINGFLIKNRSVKDMANKILYLLENKYDAYNIGLCARENASMYDVNKVKSEWIKII